MLRFNNNYNSNGTEKNATLTATDTYSTSKCQNECNASVISSNTLTGAENYPWFGGEYKVPKVLAEFVIQIDIESKIRLNEPSYEIKRIEKQIFLTQCKYIPPTDKVFFEGYVRENIEYATKSCSHGSAIGGSIKDITVHIPFKAYTKVEFDKNRPKVQPNLPPMVARYFDEKRMGKNFREADRSNIEFLNEPVYCELEWTAVFDATIDGAGTPIDGFLNEEVFQEFTDKSVVYICTKLLQKQQVCFHEPKTPYSKEDSEEDSYPVMSDWNFPISEISKKK